MSGVIFCFVFAGHIGSMNWCAFYQMPWWSWKQYFRNPFISLIICNSARKSIWRKTLRWCYYCYYYCCFVLWIEFSFNRRRQLNTVSDFMVFVIQHFCELLTIPELPANNHSMNRLLISRNCRMFVRRCFEGIKTRARAFISVSQRKCGMSWN